MAERQKNRVERSAAEQLTAIEERQSRLLSELDELNTRVEAALAACVPDRQKPQATA